MIMTRLSVMLALALSTRLETSPLVAFNYRVLEQNRMRHGRFSDVFAVRSHEVGLTKTDVPSWQYLNQHLDIILINW